MVRAPGQATTRSRRRQRAPPHPPTRTRPPRPRTCTRTCTRTRALRAAPGAQRPAAGGAVLLTYAFARHATGLVALHAGVAFLKAGENLSSVYTLCAMSLGVGVFVLPSVLKDMGLLAGLVAIGFFGLWANWMQLVLIKSANKFSPPIYSYEELAKKVLGWPGQFMLAFFTAVTTFLGNAAHMKTVVGILQDLLEYFVTGKYDENGKVFTKEKEVILYVFLLVIGLIKTADPEISSMRFISTASVMVVLTICLWTTGECMFWYWPHGNHEFTGHEAVHYVSDDWHVYAADLPAVAFAFSGTFCLFPVYKEMNDKTYPNVRKVVRISPAPPQPLTPHTHHHHRRHPPLPPRAL